MKDAGTTIPINEYALLMDQLGISYTISGGWIFSGPTDTDNKWLLFISLIRANAEAVIKEVVPFLYQQQIGFRLILNSEYQLHLNNGVYGVNEIGKVFTIFTKDEKQAIQIVDKILPLIADYSGPVITDAVRIGSILYGSFAQNRISPDNQLVVEFSIPKRIPFKINRKYQNRREIRRILNYRYISKQQVYSSPKSTSFKAIDLKTLSWCLIKIGRVNTAEDMAGRTIKDRMIWEKSVIDQLKGIIPVPYIIQHFEKDNDTYLIMEFIEGTPFYEFVENIFLGSKWKDLEKAKKELLLNIYLEVAMEIEKIHQHGFIHRDITDTNIIIDKGKNVRLIDFELCFNYLDGIPAPPFYTGTYGFMSPQQANGAYPDLTDDVYSLGALLQYILTGIHPFVFLSTSDVEQRLLSLTDDTELCHLALACLNQDEKARPGINEIINCLSKPSNINQGARLVGNHGTIINAQVADS